ncbi:hypothetical protein PPL_00700 [Heterostelium album PN500]|uniref:Uncharacterized protein n=1 Tax=Heterostelium pallidum (strain ATCC 26659 / Pp 5 / PN500) TaxID=670386 RepID=D3AX70_HETP5|nr:hypothetical protein PPL_00700 [Heterostelium album PN500]EFA86139.1 hypothetical protein PPL_00700 [Heterostelium album PN500]|eukprot:XP_020438244.1 hypothetical protein PPL_00700 [Heterostelium album PN500]
MLESKSGSGSNTTTTLKTITSQDDKQIESQKKFVICNCPHQSILHSDLALSGSGETITHHYSTSDCGEVHETKTTTTSTTSTRSRIRTREWGSGDDDDDYNNSNNNNKNNNNNNNNDQVEMDVHDPNYEEEYEYEMEGSQQPEDWIISGEALHQSIEKQQQIPPPPLGSSMI